jgi:hypothetical protein
MKKLNKEATWICMDAFAAQERQADPSSLRWCMHGVQEATSDRL